MELREKAVLPHWAGGLDLAYAPPPPANHQTLPLVWDNSGKEALVGQGQSWGHSWSLRGWRKGPRLACQ